ncbi:hypothetical protein JB92DRAFT_2980318 [Gautieria morchelliformis]|nr:hypothetical protein JB92DRAFT_3014901 [Gautieria morchelliformis]KAF8500022.1 hypothetical protein JB92DRAFT_2980318 [Gautieria morchelliformis]
MLIPCEYSAIPAAEYGHLHGVRLSACWSSAIPAAEYTNVGVRRGLRPARSILHMGAHGMEMMVLGLGPPPGHEKVCACPGVVGNFGERVHSLAWSSSDVFKVH